MKKNVKKVAKSVLNKYQVPLDKLNRKCDYSSLGFVTTKELPQWKGMLDQKDALDAIEFGLSIKSRGFNIFAVGNSGSGKTSTITRIVKQRALKDPIPGDICYIYNFDDPYEPIGLILPAGKGALWAELMRKTHSELQIETQRILTAPAMNRLRSDMTTKARKALNDSLQELMEEATARGIHIKVSEDGDLVPAALFNGELITEEEMMSFEEVDSQVLSLQQQLNQANLELLELTLEFDRRQRTMEKDFQDIIDKEEVKRLTPLIERLLKEVKEKLLVKNKTVDAYFSHLKDYFINNYLDFVPKDFSPSKEDEMEIPPEILEQMKELVAMGDALPVEFRINVLVDRSKAESAPVITEKVPSFSNLLGYLEYNEMNGALNTDHSLIRPGALHKANGGYLILQCTDVLSNNAAWYALKKALRHRELRVEELRDKGRPRITGTVKPAPVPLDVKVILVGNDDIFYILQNHDEEFNRLFKVKADFSPFMDRNEHNIMDMARFLGQVCEEENFLPLHARAVARIVEFSSRITSDQDLVTNKTSTLIELIAESDFWARERTKRPRFIDLKDVEKALDERKRRHNRIEKLALREIKTSTILIDIHSEVVGQINGMAVYDMGDYAFGIPSRITAITYAGDKGIVNIDREVNLSGNIHDKGSLIMVGYLSGRFAKEKPMNISASITFEQSYSQVEGDSASSTELFALLSSLSDIPIYQGIAVTGSVNQQGVIQAIGGVNEKIEGFFEVCKMQGFTHDRGNGVIIPKANVRNLMLDDEVVDAVKDGKFTIYAISTIDEGIEILTGVKSGVFDKEWTKGSVNYYVQERITELSEDASLS
ncbi:MAG: AAA family ATPase [Deltaproteobacteria bacterium]|nr:AAA family ATPase [Deltaproteobacteria bacterium]